MEIVEMGKLLSLKTRLSLVSPETTQHSIYRVPRHLRDVNNKAYQPQIVAIGPYHRGKPELKEMEEVKLRYMQALLERKPDVPLEHYISAVEGIAEKARKCYAEPPMKLDPGDGEFTDMLVLDGCFIIEVIQDPELFSCTFPGGSSDRILQQDLILLENQIPLFVLCKLFDLIEGPEKHNLLMKGVLIFCDVVFPERILYLATTMRNSDEVKHILHLIHINLCPSDHHTTSVPDQYSSNSSLIPSASELKVANVTFCNKEYHCPSDPNDDIGTILKEDKVSQQFNIFQAGKCTSLFDVKFNKNSGKMLMPRLVIDDGTESFLRNLIAYEQLLPEDEPTYVTDYTTLLDRLINTSKDLQILCRANIIKNMLGSEEAVVDFVNRLTDAVILHEDSSVYADTFRRINDHNKKPWNIAVAALRRDYFNTPWSYIAFLAALMLFLFTAAQTIFSALQMF